MKSGGNEANLISIKDREAGRAAESEESTLKTLKDRRKSTIQGNP